MSFYLLTAESSRRFGSEVQVMPTIRLKDLIEQAPDLMAPMPGDALELRLPDGEILIAAVARFGIEAWELDGKLQTYSDPSDPVLTLSIADLGSDRVPVGTEVWLAEPRYHGPAQD
jgi:hypothetical protein